MRFRPFVAVALALAVSGASSARAANPRERFADVVAEFARDGKDGARPGTGRFEVLADEVWKLAGGQVVSLLARRADAKAADLVAAVTSLAGKGGEPPDALGASAVPLSGGPGPAWAVAVNWYYSGNVLIVARGAAGWEVLWTVRAYARRDGPHAKDLERWARYTDTGWHDGPFAGTVLALPGTSSGRARFALDAVAQPAMGLSCPAQLSVWEWDGERAVPVLLDGYTTLGEGTARRVGNTLVVKTIEPLKSTFPCGSCENVPLATWRVVVGPDGVSDRGRVSHTPGLALVDEVVDGVCRGRDVAAHASPAARRALATWHAEAAGSAGDPEYCMGMLEAWATTTTPTGLRVTVTADALGTAVFEIRGTDATAHIERVIFKR